MPLVEIPLHGDLDCLTDGGDPELSVLPADESGLAECAALAAAWKHSLRAYRYKPETNDASPEEHGFICLFLDEPVEKQVDAAWVESPSRGYMLHLVARNLCMAALRSLVKEAAFNNCAPLPELSGRQSAELREKKLTAGPGNIPVLKRKYALVTWEPYRGGCEVCALAGNCTGPDSAAQIFFRGSSPPHP